MSKEKQMQVKKLYEWQAIKPAAMQTSAEARIAALEAQLWINSQPEKGNAKHMGETPEEQCGEKQSCCDMQDNG